MSVYSSGRKSFVSHRSSLAKAKKVENFKFTDDLKKLIQNFVSQKELKHYEELVCHIRDSGLEIKDEDLIKLLKEARACISLLDKNVHLFVKVLLIQKWSSRSTELVEEYQGFLLDLCSAHSYYTGLAINQLVVMFRPDEESEAEWTDGKPSEDDQVAFNRVHNVLKTLLRVIPMSSELLSSSLTKNFPYHTHGAHLHECYIYNLLKILQYQPSMRRDILSLIISKMVDIDTHAPKREIEQAEMEVVMEEDMLLMEGVNTMKSTKHEIAHTLDVCMDMMFAFFESELPDTNNWDKTRLFYYDLIYIFDSVIMPTFALHHVQFLLFRFVSKKSTLYNMFLQHLWKKVSNVNTSAVIRQSAVAYVASLLSRASYIPLGILKETLSNFSSWIHGYIAAEDSQDRCSQSKRVHCVFYSICQALFFVIASRHNDFVHSSKGLMFLQGLNLYKIASCKLNPLRVCLPHVVDNFAEIAKKYQLAYCYSIMEHNSRNSLPVIERDESGLTTVIEEVYLDTFFPFEPYLLQRSKKYIDPLYRSYNGRDEVSYNRPRNDEDDFLMECSTSSVIPSVSYGSSPGF